FIKKKNVAAHKTCMLFAFFTCLLFLTSYLYYHYLAGSNHFTGTGWIRPLYFIILISHTVLAAVIVPMILMSLRRAFRENFVGHVKIARWTWPLWMYVSVTGVVIYW